MGSVAIKMHQLKFGQQPSMYEISKYSSHSFWQLLLICWLAFKISRHF